MRIKFLENTDVNIDDVPKTARGALGIHIASSKPSFRTETQVAHDKSGKPITHADGRPVEITVGKAEMQKVQPASKHFFRKDWPVILPDEMAQAYIDAGQAVLVEKRVQWISSEDGETIDGLYTPEDQELFFMGVIMGYAKGSKRGSPIYIHGPNWDKWHAVQNADDQEGGDGQ